jgi:protein TonB
MPLVASMMLRSYLAFAAIALMLGCAATPPPDPRRAELLRLNAEIERRLQQEGGPVRYLTQATEDEPFKSYYRRFVERIEVAGTANFPKSHGKSIYGSVLALVYVESDGRIQAVHVAQADSKDLEAHAIKTLRSAAPLESFTPEMKALANRVVLSANFKYSKE